MLNIMDTVNRMLGRYTIDGHYVGKAKFEIILKAAERLYEETVHMSLVEIAKAWKEELDKAVNDSHISTMLAVGEMPEHAQNFADDSIGRFVMARCYEYVTTKRYEQEFGRKLGGE